MNAQELLDRIKPLPKPQKELYHTEGFLIYPSYYEAMGQWEEQQMIINGLKEMVKDNG